MPHSEVSIACKYICQYSFMPCLHYLLGYYTGEFQALQLIVLAAFGVVD